MSDFFLGFMFSSMFGFIVGLIRPTLIANRSRKYISLLFLGCILISLVLFSTTYSSNTNLLSAVVGILSIPSYIIFRNSNHKKQVHENKSIIKTTDTIGNPLEDIDTSKIELEPIIKEESTMGEDPKVNCIIEEDSSTFTYKHDIDNLTFDSDIAISYDFVAIDFETANSYNGSACSIGLVAIKDNEIAETFSTLIKPLDVKFEEKNIEVHDITAQDVQDAPTFKEVWEKIKHYFNGDTTIVAHNAAFDMSVLKLCLMDHIIPIPDFEYMDSISISTCACRGEDIGRSLKARTERFGVELENHHDALSDAIACAKLVLKCIEEKRRRSFSTYLSTYNSLSLKNFSELKPLRTFGNKKKFESIKISEIEATTAEIDENHVLFNKSIVFTGELQNIQRKEAMQFAKNCGANIRSSVSRKTDYLVVGIQDKSIVGQEGISTKEKRAYELIDEGYEINIIDETQFIELIGEDQYNRGLNVV